MTKRALVLGCGGTLGFAWTAVALAAVEAQLGWDAREADVLVGTSAGAEMAAFLGSGIGVGEIMAALHGEPADDRVVHHLARHPGMLPPLPTPVWPGLGLTAAALRGRVDLLAGLAGALPRGRGDAGWLRDLGAALANAEGWVEHPRTWLVGADLRTGERVAFGDSRRIQLGTAIAASWAIPGWFPPVAVNGRPYVDGGTVSPTSADLVIPAGVEEVVLIPPMSTSGGAPGRGFARVERLARRAMTRRVDAEVKQLRAAGIRVLRIEPGQAELDVMGPNFMDLRRRADVLSACRTLTPPRVRAAIDQGAIR
ncbi:patatin-like phospholipase family protein [Amycolatopsis sp. FU40]|uniref:patatin-like phospholipase family protein n=1 Tax=Amycolatopsis sp. FU40 TaxID=2914159 RepID=UPI001F00D14E|nr:patatin-like phospholipase family protein [Amycolatopsis sp. FU40]UKD53637.1 patatin-like phospholipase family protein [Amycolatopsis sp. FU40]